MSLFSDTNNEDTNYDTPIYTVTTKVPIIFYDETYESRAMLKSLRNIPSTKIKKIRVTEIQLYNKERYYYELPVTTKGKEINDIHTIDLYKTNFPDYYAYKYSIPYTYTYGTHGVKGVTQTKKEEIVRTSIFYTKDQYGKFNKMLTKSNHKESEIKSIKKYKENNEYYDPREYYEDTEYIMVFKFENDEWDNPEQYLNHMNELEEEIRIYNEHKEKRKEQKKQKRKEYRNTFNSGILGPVQTGRYDLFGNSLYGGKKTKKHLKKKNTKKQIKKIKAKKSKKHKITKKYIK